MLPLLPARVLNFCEEVFHYKGVAFDPFLETKWNDYFLMQSKVMTSFQTWGRREAQFEKAHFNLICFIYFSGILFHLFFSSHTLQNFPKRYIFSLFGRANRTRSC